MVHVVDLCWICGDMEGVEKISRRFAARPDPSFSAQPRPRVFDWRTPLERVKRNTEGAACTPRLASQRGTAPTQLVRRQSPEGRGISPCYKQYEATKCNHKPPRFQVTRSFRAPHRTGLRCACLMRPEIGQTLRLRASAPTGDGSSLEVGTVCSRHLVLKHSCTVE